METEVIHTTRKGKSILLFFPPYFELFRRIGVFPIQTLIITPLRNVILTVTRELGLPVVLDGILTSLDHREDVVLVMLDLSAAFDTLDHEILISRLRSYFGVSDTVLHWFSSYLSGRTQSVIIGNTSSNPRPVDFGVPQGSILGPLLFNLYVAPLQDIVAANNLDSMFYADDSQIYIAIKPNDQSSALATLRNCVNVVINWNTQNMLLCNPGKTEVIQFTSRFVQNPVLSQFSFGNTIIELSDKVRDLGVILDKELNLRQRVNDTCKESYFCNKVNKSNQEVHVPK